MILIFVSRVLLLLFSVSRLVVLQPLCIYLQQFFIKLSLSSRPVHSMAQAFYQTLSPESNPSFLQLLSITLFSRPCFQSVNSFSSIIIIIRVPRFLPLPTNPFTHVDFNFCVEVLVLLIAPSSFIIELSCSIHNLVSMHSPPVNYAGLLTELQHES